MNLEKVLQDIIDKLKINTSDLSHCITQMQYTLGSTRALLTLEVVLKSLQNCQKIAEESVKRQEESSPITPLATPSSEGTGSKTTAIMDLLTKVGNAGYHYASAERAWFESKDETTNKMLHAAKEDYLKTINNACSEILAMMGR